ncbi:MAG: hypothetical protein H6600_03100 [Flavobacteriales bacterium]|nr:hypothetical protein [Flavobacteriales bacterium]
MKRIQIIIILIVVIISSCKKDASSNIEILSSIGCIDDTQITNIPYLTTLSELKSGITIDDNTYDYNIYRADGITIATDLETGDLLIIKKDNEIIKQYYLQKQMLISEIIINDLGTSCSISSQCGNKSTSKSTAVTLFFDAVKDSTYTIYVRNGDSAYGTGYVNVKDSLGNQYLTDVISGTNAGSGCQGEPCDDAIIYSMLSKINGRVFIECYGIHSSPDDYHYLSSTMTLWVKN